MKGDFLTDAAGTLLYVSCSTGIGILISTLTRTQVAALFATTILTLIPAANFCGLTDPVSSLRASADWLETFTRLLLHYDLPRDVYQGAGFRRALRVLHSPSDRNPGADRVERAVFEETGDLNMSGKNILQLGVKEMWSLARDPIMVLLIVFAFTLSIYSISSALPDSLSQAPIAIVDEDQSALSQRIVNAFQAPCSSRRRWSRGRKWMPGWTAARIRSLSIFVPISSRTCWPGARPPFSSIPMRRESVRRSAAARMSSGSFLKKSRAGYSVIELSSSHR